jgi:protein-tyrosine-phosphatase
VDAPRPSPAGAIVSAREFGVDLRDHASRQLRYGLMESHDIVIAVEAWQHKYLKKMFMEFQDRIFLLPLFRIDASHNAYDKYNIRDPYGRNSSAYDECFEIIDKCIAGLFHSIDVNKKDA